MLRGRVFKMRKYLFTFEWVHDNRCVNDYIVEWLYKNKIDYTYSYMRLVADVYKNNQYLGFNYEKIKDDLYGVFLETV